MKLVILDRDGVINYDSPEHIKTPDEWVPIPGSLEAIARLNRVGYRVVVATNQSGLARGLFDMQAFTDINDKMSRMLNEIGGGVDAVFFCPHAPDAGCTCRKPQPGMLRDIAARLQIELRGIPVVGDAETDVTAARAAGADAVLVRSGKTGVEPPRDVPVYEDLAEFVDARLSAEGSAAERDA